MKQSYVTIKKDDWTNGYAVLVARDVYGMPQQLNVIYVGTKKNCQTIANAFKKVGYQLTPYEDIMTTYMR